MARKFRHDGRSKNIRRYIEHLKRIAPEQYRYILHIVGEDFDELIHMVDEEIERLEQQYTFSPLTSDGILDWLPDDFDDDDESDGE